jgi:hypothetical protein
MIKIVSNILNIYIVYLIYTSLKGVFGYLDFREVLIQVASSSYRVASALIIKTTSYMEPILVKKVVEIIVVETV